MDGRLGQALQRAANDYAHHLADAMQAQEFMRAVDATVTSSNGMVSVTVGAQGDVQALTFHSQRYRQMAPAELSHLVLDTIGRARTSVLRQLEEHLPSTTFAGVSLQDLMNGSADWSSLLPERFEAVELTRQPEQHPGTAWGTKER